MNRIIKILKASFLTAGILFSCLFVLSLIFEEGISKIFLKEINKKLETRVEVRSINFSLIKMFPQASIELKGISIFSSSSFMQEDFLDLNTDTLLSADRLILSLKLSNLIKKNYIIDKIVLNRARIYVYTDSLRNSNTKIWQTGTRTDSASLRLELNNVKLTDSHFKFISSRSGFCMELFVGSANNKLLLGDGNTEIRTQAKIISDSLFFGEHYSLPDNFPAEIDGGVIISRGSIKFLETEANLNGESIKISGTIKTNEPDLDLKIEGDGVELAGLGYFMPPGVSSIIKKNKITGKLSFIGSVAGKSRTQTGPSLNVGISFNNTSLPVGEKGLLLTDIEGKAVLKADLKDLNRTFFLDIMSISGIAGQASFYGSLLINEIESPHIDLSINGDLVSEDLIKLTDIKGLKQAKGIIRTNIRLNGKIESLKNPIRDDILKLDRSVNLNFNSLSIALDSFPSTIENIKGNIMLADNVWIDGLSCSIGGQNLVINGMVKGFNRWIQDQSSLLEITAGVWSDRIDTGSLLDSFSGKGPFKQEDKKTEAQNIKMNLSINCDSLVLGNMRASLFAGNIAFSPGLLNIHSFSMMSLGGTLSGNATTIRASGNRHLARGWFDIGNINIKNTFEVFSNFKQDHIISENLDGSLTGTLSVQAEITDDLKPDLSTLMVTGNYSILDGELINFEPVMKLSRFIELSELENIRFSKLENDLLIKESMIIIPRMDIRSNAFDISASGEHGFGGEYRYHIKVLLSDLLSSQARDDNTQISEFGVIEDDGLGRTSLFLEVNGNKNECNVKHDLEALRGNIREDLQEEKQTLKSILNEEFGWYQSDTLPKINQEETRKFRIIWEEADSIKTEAVSIKEKNRPILKLFKKKKKGSDNIKGSNLN